MSLDNALTPPNAPPSGTVTFLFTDIEGSTRLWEQNGREMARALENHDLIVRRHLESLGGFVFKTGGDSFYVAFETASAALVAAIDTQRALLDTSWSEGLDIKVRMSVHTGSAEFRKGDYFGQPLNRAARLLSSGHGGQILFSLASTELVRDMLPSQIELVDLGEYRLKDLVRPERIFQVVADGLQKNFAPLRTLDGYRHNLPIMVTSFIGREGEMSELRVLLSSSRVVTLTGMGGTGKTRLSLQLGAELSERFQDGVWFVELASLTEDSEVLDSVASVLGVTEEASKPHLSSLIEYLQEKETLLIFDNCEHLLNPVASLIDRIARSCPKVSILSTSRENLGVGGERQYPVPSLSTPPVKTAKASKGELSSEAAERFRADLTQYESVRLFIDRALIGDPDFLVDNESAPALAQICARLDGIPLAIELAAARCKALSLNEINDRLRDRFRLLVSGNRTALPRQQTLKALVDWSYDLLNRQEQLLLESISVFTGGFNLSLLEQFVEILNLDLDELPLDVLSSLVDKSLVMVERLESGSRYRLLQTIRDYAYEQLRQSGNMDAVRHAHCEVVFGLTNLAATHLNGPEQAKWLRTIDLEFDNIRSALRQCVVSGDHDDWGLIMMCNLHDFFRMRCHWEEGKSWLEQLLALNRSPESAHVRSRALMKLGHLSLRKGEYDYARSQYYRSLDIRKQLNSPDEIASSMHALAHVAHLEGDVIAARPLYEQSLAIRRVGKDRLAMTMTMNNLANLLQDLGEFDTSRSLHLEALVIRREYGNIQAIGQTIHNLGCLAVEMRNYEEAMQYLNESLTLMLEVQDAHSISQIFQTVGDVAASTNRPLMGAQLWGAANSFRVQIGAPVYDIDREDQNQDYERARNEVGSERFNQEWKRGEALPLEDVVRMVRGLTI